MLHRRIYQFLIVYFIGILVLLGIKYSLRLSDYVIPGPSDIWETFSGIWQLYLANVLNTLSVAVVGQIISIILAVAVGVAGRQRQE